MSGDAPRRYRFAGFRRAGLFGDVPPSLLITLAVGVIAGWLAVLAGAPLPLAVAPLCVCALVGFGRLGGRPIHELLPRLVVWGGRRLRRRHRWCRPVPLIVDGSSAAPLPRALDGLELFEVDRPWMTAGPAPGVVGVIRDRTVGTVTAVLPVSGDGQFALADPLAQDSRLDLWGLALAGFCREGGAVIRVTWRDWTSPTGVDDHLREVRTRWATEPATEAGNSYLTLVEQVAPTSVRHEVLVEVTVDPRLVRSRRHRPGQAIEAAVGVLLEELRLFASRLEHAGLNVGAPLDAASIVEATRVRSDPRLVGLVPTLSRSLAAAAGKAPADFGPLTVEELWDHVRVDSAVHRTWWFARWPRREVPAGWLDQLLFGIPATRTVTVVFEPIAPSRSDRDIDKETVTRETNAEDRARRGFRIRAADRKAAREVTLRETELNDGYAELAYVGLLTVTARSLGELDDLSGIVEQTAAQAGIELHPLYARHAAGWVSSLPLGRSVARRIGQ
ncbi:MAG: SCO6880 family protein [Ilumatobacteraceae bacterium]